MTSTGAETISALLLQGGVTLFAAFGGAYFAFKLEENARRSNERNKKIINAYKLRTTLLWSINNLSWIKNKISALEGKASLVYAPYPSAGLSSYELEFDLNFLDPLLPEEGQLNTDEPLLFEILLAVRSTLAINEQLRERAAIQESHVQPAVQKWLETNNDRDLCDSDVESVLERRFVVRMRSLSEHILRDVPDQLLSQQKLLDRLDSALLERYPEIRLRDVVAKDSVGSEEKNV